MTRDEFNKLPIVKSPLFIDPADPRCGVINGDNGWIVVGTVNGSLARTTGDVKRVHVDGEGDLV